MKTNIDIFEYCERFGLTPNDLLEIGMRSFHHLSQTAAMSREISDYILLKKDIHPYLETLYDED